MIPYIGIHPRGSIRRLQALHARGWSFSAIGRVLGCSHQNISQILSERALLHPKTAQKVANVYEALWDRQPPLRTPWERNAAVRALNRARRHGWAPPLAWDDIDLDEHAPTVERDRRLVDDVAVDLAVEGQPVRLSPLERRAAVRQLHAAGHGDGAIAIRLQMPKRVAFRIRAEELHLPANLDAAGERIAS